ncbi:molybdopterin-containing oxidoreductase family protein [Polyangium mundeleinium]|uniref:Molybdopterin-dependent oxidoreductase n=1 Tax=Polyangium mundeleinium TaxID=2995306 RepID=A0ABT5ELQ9_9BACT|nr:molybdopterin-dependent oxidoreductase [Polyangium mundeleinium]MDC0742753.1 molybdopterin-dependent oxidoreductase [Polyangium mundeleinium]
MADTHPTFCRICEALCGLEADVEGGRVIALRPDARHVATEGFACPKGLKQHRMYASPDRVRRPLARRGERFEPASWDAALADIGARVRRIHDEHGPDSIAMYVGTAAGFSVLHPVFAQGFMQGLGSRSMYASATQDCSNKFAVSREMYGFPFTLSFPDLDRTRCLIVVGANPVVSKWSFLQVPNPARALKDIEARGGKLFVVDPRRTESAKVAGEHVFIRPDTDVWFFLSFLRELAHTGGIDRARAARFMKGLDEVLAVAEPWTPERTTRVTGITPDVLRAMVRAYRDAGRAAIYVSTGVNMGRNGSLAFWLAECINAASGNLDREGGTLVGRGIFDFAAFGRRTGTLLREDRSRIGDFRSVNDAFPGGLLADEILTEGPGKIRALFVTGGNPLITMPGSGRLRRAFEQLDLLVTVDLFVNETGSLAHWVLPATSPLERADLPFIFPLLLGLQRRPYLQATRPVVKQDGDQRDEATIYLDLCRAAGKPIFGSSIAQRALEMLTAARGWFHPDEPRSLPQELLLSAMLLATGNGTFGRLAEQIHGRLRPPHRADDFLGKRVITKDGKVNLAPDVLLSAAKKLDADYEAEITRAGKLKLVTRRRVTTHNSWTHNLEDFAEPDGGTNHLYVHPEDAKRIGLSDGDFADVSTDVATVRVPVRLLADLMPGTVALPHGWGHQHAVGLSVARTTRGVNVNLLAADGPERLERVSGMAHLTGFVVDVVPARGPKNDRSWSGLPEEAT